LVEERGEGVARDCERVHFRSINFAEAGGGRLKLGWAGSSYYEAPV